MEVRLAEHMGMCFGVRDAVDLALQLTRQGPITILGDLVHNPDVVAQLDAAGAARTGRIEDVQTQALLLTAHGTSRRVRLQLLEQGHEVHDATCPLVKRAHLAVLKLAQDGYHPVIIGQENHVEVRGLVGDLDDYTVILSDADLRKLDEPVARGGRLGVASQTTQPLAVVLRLVQAIRRRFPNTEVKFVDTVCQPTKDRQESVHRLAATCDVIVVVGGPESNNSHKLAELARSLGRPAYLVGGAGELRPEWFVGMRVVGVTAGTSTPDPAIDSVRVWLEKLPFKRGRHAG